MILKCHLMPNNKLPIILMPWLIAKWWWQHAVRQGCNYFTLNLSNHRSIQSALGLSGNVIGRNSGGRKNRDNYWYTPFLFPSAKRAWDILKISPHYCYCNHEKGWRPLFIVVGANWKCPTPDNLMIRPWIHLMAIIEKGSITRSNIFVQLCSHIWAHSQNTSKRYQSIASNIFCVLYQHFGSLTG